MRIYIPTRGRVGRQIFYNALPRELKSKVTFVVNEDDAAKYPPEYRLAVVPRSVGNIGEKRHWIMHTHHKVLVDGATMVMCDDDLRLNRRREDEPTKFRPMLPDDYIDLYNYIEHQLETYAHVTVMPREGGNRVFVDQVCGRAMRILGYNAGVAQHQKVDFTRCPTKEDFDVTLQLLRAGYKNCIIAGWVQDDGGGSNASGGCSIYRDHIYMDQRANDLHMFHPQFVKVVQKETKGAWGGGTRTDVQIQWKEAYKSSLRGMS